MAARIMLSAVAALALAASLCEAGQTSSASATSSTRDIVFMSHDGYEMRGRLTLPTTPGRHPVLVLVQTAEATAMEPMTRNAKGERTPVYSLYRDNLTPIGIGFFAYEGRGVRMSATGGREIERAIYDTSTLDNKVRDGIAAIRTLQKEAGVDASQIFLRGISEGTLLAAEIASRVPTEVKGLVLSGVIGDTLKSSLEFMAGAGTYLQHLGHWDANGDGRISAQEFETDPKAIRKQLPDTVTFKTFDTNGDGFYTREDRLAVVKPLLDEIRAGNLDVIEAFLKPSAVVEVPSRCGHGCRITSPSRPCGAGLHVDNAHRHLPGGNRREYVRCRRAGSRAEGKGGRQDQCRVLLLSWPRARPWHLGVFHARHAVGRVRRRLRLPATAYGRKITSHGAVFRGGCHRPTALSLGASAKAPPGSGIEGKQGAGSC
jgi:pimeloyl-ACP methyl ester carboxylesterase